MDGYIGNSVDSNRIAKMNKKREEEVAKFESLKQQKEANAKQSRLLAFGHSATEVVEQAFK
eukprot:CAMPEP_0197863534 /NCGR_PEP_ID=MMETSP1438-20131217/41046_1 /TAXON_ID=1461541 /ORGANISM="Pterosperma sp., Strain CCMP1384" /LENGTH=60 /DNA_ID=CAMNT_0043481461 /DNA_START=72 /DNA_END=251 /DNA_ORIENTATION=-